MAKMQYQYSIGQWVACRGTVEAEYENTEDEPICAPNAPRKLVRTDYSNSEKVPIGQISGMKRLFLGKYRPRQGYMDVDGGGYEDPYLKVESSQLVYLVRQGMLNKEIQVLLEDLKPLEKGSYKAPLPILHSPPCKIDTRDRQMLSKEAQSWPRDAKGRWTK